MSKIHIISTPEIYFLHFRRDDKGKYSKHKNFFPTYTKRKDGEKLILNRKSICISQKKMQILNSNYYFLLLRFSSLANSFSKNSYFPFLPLRRNSSS